MIMSTSLWKPCVAASLHRHSSPSWENRVVGKGTKVCFPRNLLLVKRIANGGCNVGMKELPSWRLSAVLEGQEQGQMDQDRELEVERAKMDLFQSVLDTKRGAQVTLDQRAAIEEAMVGVEKFNAGAPFALDKLHGTWLLQYTTAPDVIALLKAANFPFLKVGQVYQNFDCKGRTDGGTVENIVRWSVPGLLQKNEGATFIVSATFTVASPRSIVLKFEEARVTEVEISAELESFITPAILPRTFINLQILQFLRSFDLRFPLRASQTQPNNSARAPIGAWYNLTFVDNNTLLGRALDTGGVFVFSRTQARRKSV